MDDSFEKSIYLKCLGNPIECVEFNEEFSEIGVPFFVGCE